MFFGGAGRCGSRVKTDCIGYRYTFVVWNLVAIGRTTVDRNVHYLECSSRRVFGDRVEKHNDMSGDMQSRRDLLRADRTKGIHDLTQTGG